jgi:hypothetical protein
MALLGMQDVPIAFGGPPVLKGASFTHQPMRHGTLRQRYYEVRVQIQLTAVFPR